ncbi:exported hypothetical protein [Capnocytophaga cynodegmi]|uniref:Uncharacterized protein n=1 Tax=Capnocytophaga cynodegmi TaxID=28189 RepID=A0A0B7HPN3_9FLAO|nr:exported hypothetical protein [Capnocytophaga cynodegmi]
MNTTFKISVLSVLLIMNIAVLVINIFQDRHHLIFSNLLTSLLYVFVMMIYAKRKSKTEK